MVTTFQHQEPAPRVVLASAVALMVHYFDIREGDAWTEVLSLSGYNPPSWIRIAVIEALYQGRYKVISVQQILDIWRRRGKILAHFNREFEAIVTVPLPDRVQAQLRALAREHQLEHRQQREDREASALTFHRAPPLTPIPLAQTTSAEEAPDPSATRSIADSPVVSGTLLPFPSPNADPSTESSQEELPSNIIPPVEAVEAVKTVEAVKLSLSQMSQSTLKVNDEPGEQRVDSVPSLVEETDSPSVASPIPSIPPHSPGSDSPSHWSPLLRRSSSQIDQFCPTPDPSGFDRKLLALANQP